RLDVRVICRLTSTSSVEPRLRTVLEPETCEAASGNPCNRWVAIHPRTLDNSPVMTDRQKLEQLYLTRHPVVTIQTFEEEYVLGLYREIAVEGQCELWIWSATDGLHDGLVANSTPIADTDKPAPALYFLSRERRKPGIYVMLDLAGYLKDDRVLRCLREAIANLGKTGCQVIMIDLSA